MRFLADLAAGDAAFPDTDDIAAIAQYIYPKLDHTQTKTFQQILMMWLFVENGMKQPTGPDVLDKINHVVRLQNNDPRYRKKFG